MLKSIPGYEWLYWVTKEWYVYSHIIQFSKQGEKIKEWVSATEAARQLGICQSNISACCMWKDKTYKGYLWKYSP